MQKLTSRIVPSRFVAKYQLLDKQVDIMAPEYVAHQGVPILGRYLRYLELCYNL